MITRPKWLCTVDGEYVDVGDVSINQSLGEALTTVADIEIVSATSTPFPGTPVYLWYADLNAGEAWPVFYGEVDSPIGNSFPNRVSIRCQGPLSKLRDKWDADYDFTGLYGHQVIDAALTNIPHDNALIQEDSLLLGVIESVVVRTDTKKAGIANEVNRLLSMVLIEYGFNIHRFYVNRVPSAADIVRTFVRGVDCGFASNEAVVGPIDEMSNYWKVEGKTYDCGTPSGDPPSYPCRCTIWASAQGPNPVFGTGQRTEPSQEGSDLIQDQDFAEWVITQRIDLSNRMLQRLTITSPYDPGLHVGDVIGVFDDIRGIQLLADAEDEPFLIEQIDVRNTMMTMSVRGRGTPYDYDVFSGNEKRCNKTTKPGPALNPGFTPPGLWPRIFVTPEPWNPCEQPTNPVDCVESAFAVDTVVISGYDWKVSGRVVFTAAGQSLKIGVDATSGEYTVTFGTPAFYTSLMLTPQLYELNGPSEYRHRSGIVEIGLPIDYILQWDQSEGELLLWFQVNDGECFNASAGFGAGTIGGATTLREVTGTPTLTAQAMKINCGYEEPPPPSPIEWTADDGTWIFDGPDAEKSDNNSGHCESVSLALDFTLASTWTISGTITSDHGAFRVCFVVTKEDPDFFDPQNVGVANLHDWGFGRLSMYGSADLSYCPSPNFSIVQESDYTVVDTTPDCWDGAVPIDFEMTWSLGVLTVTLTQGARVETGSNPDGLPFMPAGPYWLVFGIDGKWFSSPDTLPYSTRLRNLVVEITP